MILVEATANLDGVTEREKPTEFPKLNIAVSSARQNPFPEFGILGNCKPPDAYFCAPPAGKKF